MSDHIPHWDLSNVYPSLESPEFIADGEKLRTQVQELQTFFEDKVTPITAANTPTEIEAVLSEAVARLNDIYEFGMTYRAYVSSFVSTDSFNKTALRLMSELDKPMVALRQIGVQFDTWVGSLKDVLPQVLEIEGTARQHAFALLETAEQAKYMMSTAEENLAAELSTSGSNAWNKLQGTITSQLTVDFELDGEVKTLPMPALINLHGHPDESVRRRAHAAEIKAWESVKEPLAACLNSIKGTVNTLNKRRGREDALHSAVDGARIDRDTLTAMMSAMEDSFPMFRKYFRAKAQRIGKEQLDWWDLFAPVGAVTKHYTFAEAREFILENYARFSQEMADFAQQAFDNNWIDAESRSGKRGGAFCMGVPGVRESRILCNFDGSLDQVFTIAHELGHGFHNYCAYQADKTMLQKQTPMTMAETASIMCETIVTNAALAQAQSEEEKLAILETTLIGASQVVVDIYSRFLFEKEIFERREQAELSADDICDAMHRAQLATYGDGVSEDSLHSYMWTWKPHYYYPGLSFYNFPYTFGLLFGLGLYAIYQERGEAFIPDYKALLASTGEASAADLAAQFGINIRSKEFWAGSLALIGERVEAYLAL